MVAAVVQGHLDVHQRIAGQDAQFNSSLHALIDGLDVFLRNRTALDRINEFVALAWLVRLNA